jgi:DNA repair exonuclease SbcCD ATPase subunit
MNIDINFLKKAKERGICPLIVDHSHYENIVSRNDLEDKHYEQKIFDGAKILMYAQLKDVIEFKMALENIYTDFNFVLDSFEERSCHVTECKATIVLKRKTLEEITESPEYKLATEKVDEIKRLKKEAEERESRLENIENKIIRIAQNAQKAIDKADQLKLLDDKKQKLKQDLLGLNETLDELRSQLLKEGVVEDCMDIRKYAPKE